MARTSLRPCKFVLDVGSLSHRELIIVPGQETKGDNFGMTKTCLYKFDPLKPHKYIAKLWFTGAYIIFSYFVKNIDYGYSLEPPRRCFDQKYMYEKYQNFFS